MFAEEDRTKMAQEINQTATKVAQEKYLERAKIIVNEIKQETGKDLSNLIIRTRSKIKECC
jgi:hypothetical protein